MDRICPFCKKILTKNSAHIYNCNDTQVEMSHSDIRYKYISFNFPEISKKEVLLEEYEKNLKSLPDLKKIYGIDSKALVFLLDFFSIKRRSISESCNSITKNKYKQTCIDKYGVDHSSKSDIIKEKKKKTFHKNYGTDNIWKSIEFKNKYFNNDDFWLEKYGMTRYELASKNSKLAWESKTDEERYVWLSNSIHSPSSFLKSIKGYRVSSLEKRIDDILCELKFTKTTQFYLKITNKKRYFYDFYLNDYNLILEIQGDYWHANPLIYNENDILFYRFGKIKAADIWEKDRLKKEAAINHNYDIIYIWEHDIKKLNKDELKDFLLKNIGDKLNEYTNQKNKTYSQ